MADDFHGRLDDVVAADFCGFSFFNSHFFDLKQYRQAHYQPLLRPRLGNLHSGGKKRQQPEWLLPKGTPFR
jgi:hypothetical protein